jgi:hypothetical protein
VLELAPDLGLFDEAADHLRAVEVPLQENLDGHVAAQIHVATLEHDAHAPAGNLAVELVAPCVAYRDGYLLGGGSGRPLLAGRAFAEQHAGDRPERLIQGREDARGASQAPRAERRHSEASQPFGPVAVLRSPELAGPEAVPE